MMVLYLYVAASVRELSLQLLMEWTRGSDVNGEWLVKFVPTGDVVSYTTQVL